MSGERRRAEAEGAAAADFLKLLEHLKASRGFDFSGYKVSSLMRRVRKRMQQVGAASYSDYVDYLEVHQDEVLPLFNTVLINVTSFFRDPEAWEVVAGRGLGVPRTPAHPMHPFSLRRKAWEKRKNQHPPTATSSCSAPRPGACRPSAR